MSDSEPAGTSDGKTETPAPKTIFVISPIGSTGTPEHRRYWNTLEYIVKKAFHAPDWVVVRADEEKSPDSITNQVISRIVESDLIIADLTDHNPNVFYELAVAHGFQKQVIHMMQSGQDVPFDVGDQRVIFYDLTDPESVDKARGWLIASAKWLEANPGQMRNPLSTYGLFRMVRGEGGEAVAVAIETLSRQVARIEGQLSSRGSTHVPTPARPSITAVEKKMVDLLGADAWSSSQRGYGPTTLSFESYRRQIGPELLNAISNAATEAGWYPELTVDDDGRLTVELYILND